MCLPGTYTEGKARTPEEETSVVAGTRDRGDQARQAVRVEGGVTSLTCKAPFSIRASLVAQMVKNPPANEGDPGSIPGLGRSPGEGNGYPLLLAWKTPWIEEPGELHTVQRVGYD